MTITSDRTYTVEEYHKMGEMGFFAPDERVELLGGRIRTMSPVGRRHVKIVRRLTKSLVRRFGDFHEVDIQNPVRLSDESEPEPDAMVVRADEDVRNPTATTVAGDVLILAEVSDSTLAYDLNEKLPEYAATGIPEVWVIDVNRNTLTQYHTPRDGLYVYAILHRKGDLIHTTLGEVIPADEVLL